MDRNNSESKNKDKFNFLIHFSQNSPFFLSPFLFKIEIDMIIWWKAIRIMGLCQTKAKLNLKTTQADLVKDSLVISDLDISRYDGVPIPKPPPLRRESPSDYDIVDAAHLSIGYDQKRTYLSPLESCECCNSCEPI